METKLIYNWIKPIDFTKCIKFKDYNNTSKFIKICDIVLDNDLTKDNKKRRKTLIKLDAINQKINIKEKNNIIGFFK